MFAKHHCTAALVSGLTFAALLFSGCSHKEPQVKTGLSQDTVYLGFYNVENLFDLFDNGTEYPEFRPGALGWNKQTWRKKNAGIASVIAAMNVPVIGLVEVENGNALKALQAELKRQGCDFPFRAIADAPFRTATCPALLSKYPILRVHLFGGGDSSTKRNILEAAIAPGGAALTLFVSHWPSKTYPESRRLALARVLEKRLSELPKGTDYVILGDLNTDFDEWSTFHTEGRDDTRGTVGLNHVLRTVLRTGEQAFSPVTASVVAAQDSFYHYDPWAELRPEERASLYFRHQRETPDHILLPHALFDSLGWSYQERSFSVFHWDGRILRNGEPWRWQMQGFGNRRFHVGDGYSDHLPLKALLIRRPAAARRAAPGAPSPVPEDNAGGFELSTEGWIACGNAASVGRDSSLAASGRFCLKIAGPAQAGNGCAARVRALRSRVNSCRSVTISFDIRGQGKIALRVRAGRGSWRAYNGASFAQSGSIRYQKLCIPRWRHVALDFTSDSPSAPDLELEFRTGTGEGFCFWLDNVRVR